MLSNEVKLLVSESQKHMVRDKQYYVLKIGDVYLCDMNSKYGEPRTTTSSTNCLHFSLESAVDAQRIFRSAKIVKVDELVMNCEVTVELDRMEPN